MEESDDFSYTTLKNSLLSIPAKVLNYSARLILSNNLDVKIVLPARNGHARDYRGLAELMGFQFYEIKKFERYEDPTMKILESWETQPDATLYLLISYLEEMERYDVIKELTPLLERDVKIYLQNSAEEIPIQVDEVTSCPENMQTGNDLQLITRDDLTSGGHTYYDAYVCYADEDCEFVKELAERLESPANGFKLFIHGRDMLAGCAELATNISLIKKRCSRMLIILSPHFIKSRACEFQANFAASLAIEQRKRMLIPVVLSPCKIPSILKYISKIDFTTPDIQEWVWAKLMNSLCELRVSPPVDPQPVSNYAIKSEPTYSDPMITFPETKKFSLYSVDTSVTPVSSDTPVASAEIIAENSVVSNFKINMHKKWKLKLSTFKKRPISSSTSTSSLLSSATSGFHSQSDNGFETSESSVRLFR